MAQYPAFPDFVCFLQPFWESVTTVLSFYSTTRTLPISFSPEEGEYKCPVCTVFGLEDDELKELIAAGFKITDHNEEEGYEVKSSPFKVHKSNGYARDAKVPPVMHDLLFFVRS